MAVRRKKRTTKRKTVKRKPLSVSVQNTLKRKAKNSRFTYGQLARVYRRGQGAFLSSGSRPGVSMSQWAFGRVNSLSIPPGVGSVNDQHPIANHLDLPGMSQNHQ